MSEQKIKDEPSPASQKLLTEEELTQQWEESPGIKKLAARLATLLKSSDLKRNLMDRIKIILPYDEEGRVTLLTDYGFDEALTDLNLEGPQSTVSPLLVDYCLKYGFPRNALLIQLIARNNPTFATEQPELLDVMKNLGYQENPQTNQA